ncbi:MAG: NAD(P)H-dependent oxidoreductase [Nitrososphaeria archaeon]
MWASPFKPFPPSPPRRAELAVHFVRRGISVSSFAANDVDSGSPEEFIARANSASAMVLATPTYDSEVHPRMEYILHLIRSKMKGTGKPAAAMVSYAWGSNAARRVENALREAGLRVLGVESFRERPAPEQVARMADALAEAERGRSIGPG